MKAVRYYGPGDVRIDEIPEPETQPGTVKIAPAFTGICGSDLHLYFDAVIPPAPTATEPHPLSGETLPIVLGHEISGVVEDVGEGVTDVAVGDRVVVEPLMACGECPACRAGDYNDCVKMGFIGVSGRGGGMSEHMVVEQRFVHQVGDMPLDQATLIEPLAVAVHAVAHANVSAGQTALVGGAGPIGLLTAAVLQAEGLTVYISEISRTRKQRARESGFADVIIDPTEEDLAERISELTAGTGVDVAFDCVGNPRFFAELLSTLKRRGHLEIVALHWTKVELDLLKQLLLRELTIGGSVGYANNHPDAIELVHSGQIDLSGFITRIISPTDIVDDGLRRLRDHGHEEVKVLVSSLFP